MCDRPNIAVARTARRRLLAVLVLFLTLFLFQIFNGGRGTNDVQLATAEGSQLQKVIKRLALQATA